METLLQDLRFTLRSLLRRPMLSLTIVITFSLGVGANTAIFSVVRGVLLRPLPFRDVDTLVRLGESGPTGREFIATSMPNCGLEHRTVVHGDGRILGRARNLGRW